MTKLEELKAAYDAAYATADAVYDAAFAAASAAADAYNAELKKTQEGRTNV